jgi:hypothetical protein
VRTSVEEAWTYSPPAKMRSWRSVASSTAEG